MSAGEQMAMAARALVDARFRLHGRETATGLDCVGVVLVALGALGRAVGPLPPYSLKRTSLEPFDRIGREHGLVEATGAPMAGDVLVFRVGPAQLHAGIADGAGGIVHAHAALRRVVQGPVPSDWAIVQQWRINS